MDLLKDSIPKLVRRLAIPAIVGTLFQTFYNLVDTWFAGRISAEAIGAIAKSFPIYFVIIAVGVGIGAATGYKFVFGKGWTGEYLIGGGLNLLTGFYPRMGVVIGKRF